MFDPMDAEFQKNPYAVLKEARNTKKHFRLHSNTAVLLGHKEVSDVLRNSNFGRQFVESENDVVNSILNSDPPEHTRLRKMVSTAFGVREISKYNFQMKQIVQDRIKLITQQQNINIVSEFTFPIPFQIISKLLGIPKSEGQDIEGWAAAITALLDPFVSRKQIMDAKSIRDNFMFFILDVLKYKEKNRGEDIISMLLDVEDDGKKLSHIELFAFVTLLYIAGHETTANLAGNAIYWLLQNPQELSKIRKNGLSTNNIDELLRYDTSVQGTLRKTKIETSLDIDGEILILKPGEIVFVHIGSANHDESVFDNPDILDLDRHNANKHLSFASGPHYCLGAFLARNQIQIMLEELFSTFANIDITGEPVWRKSITFRGLDELSVSLS